MIAGLLQKVNTLRRKGFRNLRKGQAAYGVHESTVEIKDGLKGKLPFIKPRVGDDQVRFGKNKGAVQEYIYIEVARPFGALAEPIAPEGRFDRVDGREKSAWGELRIAHYGRVDKIGLDLDI
jgi:hypothetical protein